MDESLFRRLESFVSQGRVILFTGAGFSLDAQNRKGQALPTVSALIEELWDIAFPGETNDGAGLQNVFEAAAMQARGRTIELLEERLSVDPAQVPDHYRRWFSMPWKCIYTLNIDDLADVANRVFTLPRALLPVSALNDPVTYSSGDLPVVHLNGRIADLPDVTFSGRQYAERLAQPDLWYANLARELVSQPFVFVGTTLDEPPLWQYVEARGMKDPGGRELRPGSILVTRSLDRAREVSLRRYQVDYVPGTAESFERDVLKSLDDAAAQGLQVLGRSETSDGDLLERLEDRVSDSQDDEREFLRGREPRWSDLTDGYAVEREVDRELILATQETEPKLVVVTGTAASGKSTSAMRLVLELRADGAEVSLLNHEADSRAFRIRKSIGPSPAKVLFIDDLDRLGHSAVPILEDVRDVRPDLMVVAAVRSSRYEGLGVSEHVAARPDAHEAVAPPLDDEDIDALLDALTEASRLGSLQGKSRVEQRTVMTNKCGRQLLVAMIEATSGQRFEAKIESECRELSPDAAVVYCVVALAMNFRIGLSDPELLAARGGEPATTIRTIDDLLRTHLLVRDGRGRLALRHRLVSERAVDFFRASRLVETPLRGLVFALAATARPGELRASSQGRGLIRLMNHKLLIGFLRTANEHAPDVVGIRGVYEELEPLLNADHHFWLQRGSFETEEGDLDLAKNFIEQARGLAPDDPYVRTQWAYMTLKRASRLPTDAASATQVEAAFAELDEVIASRGQRDSYPFHIYGSQGLSWSKRAGLPREARETLLRALRRVVDEGIELHGDNRELKQLAKDLQTAYLKLALE